MEKNFFDISPEIRELGEKAMKKVLPYFEEIDEITEYNQLKMLRAFQNARVSESCFAASTMATAIEGVRRSTVFLPRYSIRRMPLCVIILQAGRIRLRSRFSEYSARVIPWFP